CATACADLVQARARGCRCRFGDEQREVRRGCATAHDQRKRGARGQEPDAPERRDDAPRQRRTAAELCELELPGLETRGRFPVFTPVVLCKHAQWCLPSCPTPSDPTVRCAGRPRLRMPSALRGKDARYRIFAVSVSRTARWVAVAKPPRPNVISLR